MFLYTDPVYFPPSLLYTRCAYITVALVLNTHRKHGPVNIVHVLSALFQLRGGWGGLGIVHSRLLSTVTVICLSTVLSGILKPWRIANTNRGSVSEPRNSHFKYFSKYLRNFTKRYAKICSIG